MSRQLSATELKIKQAFETLCTASDNFRTYPDIRAGQIEAAEKHFLFWRDEAILGVADETLLGGMQRGFGFTTRHIYWKNMWDSPQVISYADTSPNVRLEGSEIILNKSQMLGAYITQERVRLQLVQFIKKAREISRNALTEPSDLPGRLARICSQYVDTGFFVGASIPSNRLINARQNLNIPDHSPVFAFLDTTVLGNGGLGMAFCDDGLRWSNYGSEGFLPWHDFAQNKVQPAGIMFIKIGDLPNFPATIGIEKSKLLELLHRLQAEVRGNSGSTSSPVFDPLTAPRTSKPDLAPAQQAELPIVGSSVKPKSPKKPKSPLPLVDINNASPVELLVLPGINKASAAKLGELRTIRGGFQSVEEIGQLLHFQPHQVERLRERIEISPMVGAKPISSTRRRVVEF